MPNTSISPASAWTSASRTAICGRDVPGLEFLPSIRVQYDRIIGWLSNPGILPFHFEDLINDPRPQLERFAGFPRNKNTFPFRSDRETAIQDHSRGHPARKNPRLFRKGKTGGWRNHFSDEHKQIFKDITGDLLIELGYETDNDW